MHTRATSLCSGCCHQGYTMSAIIVTIMALQLCETGCPCPCTLRLKVCDSSLKVHQACRPCIVEQGPAMQCHRCQLVSPCPAQHNHASSAQHMLLRSGHMQAPHQQQQQQACQLPQATPPAASDTGTPGATCPDSPAPATNVPKETTLLIVCSTASAAHTCSMYATRHRQHLLQQPPRLWASAHPGASNKRSTPASKHCLARNELWASQHGHMHHSDPASLAQAVQLVSGGPCF